MRRAIDLSQILMVASALGLSACTFDTGNQEDEPGTLRPALIDANGTSVNGTSVNGTSVNGTSVNGTSVNGTSVNGTSVNGTSVNGMWVNGSQLSTSTTSGQILAGSQLLGMEFNATLYDGSQLRFRIDNIDVTPAASPADATYYYEISFINVTTKSKKRAYVCGVNDDGSVRRAIPLQGGWDYRSGVPGGGSRIDEPNAITFACEGYALYKCVDFGYKPWTTASHGDMRNHHEACTRLIRADYCGDGTSWTVDGTLVNVFDNLGVQPDTETWPTEAEWDQDGAICLSHQRIQNMPTIPQCTFQKSSKKCGTKVIWSQTLLVSEAL
jgi:hypothetical protein